MQTENKENRSPNRFSWLPKESRRGRLITDSRERDPFAKYFNWSNPITSWRRGFRLQFLFASGDAIPVFSKDELGIKESLSQVPGYMTPKKSTLGIISRVTITPRHRIFKPMVLVSAVCDGKETNIVFYQEPGNAKRRFDEYPPVVNKTPSKVKKLTPPIKGMKRARRFVSSEDIERASQRPRLPAKRLFRNVSANEIKSAESAGALEAKFALSHLDQVGAGGADVREQVTVATEGHNLMRLAFVERPGATAVKNSKHKGLHYSCDAPLKLDKDGSPTHVAGNIEISLWASPKKTSTVQVRLDPRNPERPTMASHKMMTQVFSGVFEHADSDASASEREGSEESSCSLGS